MAYLIAIAAGSLFASVLGQPTPAPAPGDECIKALTPICDPDYFGQTGLEFLTEGINDCCEDDFCRVCHPNGCDECCPGTFKYNYDEPCLICEEEIENCLLCQDFYGCGQCADGFVPVLDDEGTDSTGQDWRKFICV